MYIFRFIKREKTHRKVKQKKEISYIIFICMYISNIYSIIRTMEMIVRVRYLQKAFYC